MSDFELIEDTEPRLPEYPKLGESLLLIETHKFLPVSSTGYLDVRSAPEPEDNDLSL